LKKMMARCEQSKKTDNKLTSKIGVYMSYMQKNMYVNKYKMNSVISHFKKKLLDSQQPFLHFFFHTASIANSFPYEKSKVFSVTAHHRYTLMDAEDWNVISRNAIIAIILTRNASHEPHEISARDYKETTNKS